MRPRINRSRVSQERWLVSYADFITLLFAFFVVLYAFAKADQKRQQQVAEAIDSGFQSLSLAPPARMSGSPDSIRPDTSNSRAWKQHPASAAEVRADLENMHRDLQRRLATQIARRTVAVELSRDGLVISLREAGFFDSGTAIPRPQTTQTLQEICAAIHGTSYYLRVEGHTDNMPIHNSQFDSNWELSAARATRIARTLLQMQAVPAEQLSAAGYAEYHPVADNNTSEGRAENRRVDLVVMPHIVLDMTGSNHAENQAGWRKLSDP